MIDPVHKDIIVFADNFQFHLQDKRSDCDYPETWNEEIMNALFVAGSNVIGIGTVRDLDVEVSLDIMSTPMDNNDMDKLPEDIEDWDHAVQCTLDVPSGEMLIGGPTEDPEHAARVELAPGRYGVRIFWGNLENVDEVGFEGDDVYKIVMWPNTELETRILKRWRSLVYFDASDMD